MPTVISNSLKQRLLNEWGLMERADDLFVLGNLRGRKNLETWLDQRYAGKCLTTGSPGFKKKKKKKEAPFVC